MSIILDDSGDTWASARTELLDRLEPNDTFGADWARRKQAHLMSLDESAREWAECLVLLTFTASTTYPDTSTLMQPVTHLEWIRSSRDARQRALSRVLSGYDWRAVRTFGADKNGYQHLHVALYVGSDVDCYTFEPVFSAHTENSRPAEEKAHQLESGAVQVDTEVRVDGGRTWICGYSMCNTPGMDTRGDRDHGLRSAPRNVQRGATVLDRVDDAIPITFGRPI